MQVKERDKADLKNEGLWDIYGWEEKEKVEMVENGKRKRDKGKNAKPSTFNAPIYFSPFYYSLVLFSLNYLLLIVFPGIQATP